MSHLGRCSISQSLFSRPIGVLDLFSPYRAVSQRGRTKRGKIDDTKMSKQPPPAPAAIAIIPCPTIDPCTLHVLILLKMIKIPSIKQNITKGHHSVKL